MTFTQASQSQTVNVMTIDNNIFEVNQRICLRLTNLIEPCPGSVIVGDDIEIVVAEDESKFTITYVYLSIFLSLYCTVTVFTLQCYTNTTGNSIDGQNISLFYSSAAMALFFPQFQCALDGGALEPCMLI